MRKWGGTSREPALWTFGRPYKTPGEEPLVRAIFLWPWNENAPTKQKQQTEIQDVPIVRYSNFMHYNFWSKLYFYLKFLEGVVHFSINCTCIQNFSDWHALFFITFCSRCGMKWDTTFGSILIFFITWLQLFKRWIAYLPDKSLSSG